VLGAHLVPEGEDLRGRNVFAFAGIGRPEKFVSSLQEIGANVTGTQFFADHHAFLPGEISALRNRAGGAQLVTTEKDFVRLSVAEQAGVEVLKIAATFDSTFLLDKLLA
jgi:tetraacyldisaccharide 4'-kinase